MKTEIKLTYTPLDIEGEINEKAFDNYLIQPNNAGIAKAVAISPLEKSMKEGNRDVFEFDGFKVNKKIQNKNATSWEKVYNSLVKFLEIRADDSRAYDMDGLKFFDGLGYCILTNDLRDYVEGQQDQYSSSSEFPQLFWPRAKKGEELPTQLILPDRNYSKVNQENAGIVLNAKRFCSGLEKNVTKVFKAMNKDWFEDETGYSMNNLPKKDESPVRRAREIAPGKYVFMNLVREEVPQYRQIVDFLLTELGDIENGISLKGYKSRQEGKDTYVNIKNVFDRLSNERLKGDDLIKIEGRYEIVP